MSQFNPTASKVEVSDYEDEVFYTLLKKLPVELANNCLQKIETEEMSDDDAVSYLNHIIEQRTEVSTESVISDPDAVLFFQGNEKDIYKDIETSTFTNTENHIGSGMTARIKKYEIMKDDATLSMAIKYIVTPKVTTLTASGEHDVINEVSRMQTIEQMENKFENRSKYIRVPHTYFHHKTDRIQCYGMELINGYDLNEITQDRSSVIFQENIRNTHLAQMTKDQLFSYVDKFFNTMHEFCLHGDIKPANIMLGNDGVFYIIDFGQSILANSETEETNDQFNVLREDEITHTKTAIAFALKKIFQNNIST